MSLMKEPKSVFLESDFYIVFQFTKLTIYQIQLTLLPAGQTFPTLMEHLWTEVLLLFMNQAIFFVTYEEFVYSSSLAVECQKGECKTKWHFYMNQDAILK